MGRFSIRLKITIWFTAALVVIVLFAYLMIFVVSRQILIKTIQDSLVETVENNVVESTGIYHKEIIKIGNNKKRHRIRTSGGVLYCLKS